MWEAVERLLEHATVEGILAHKLGPLAARQLRARGRPLPSRLEDEERLTRLAWVTAGPLLGRIRQLHGGPLVLLKGPEVASLYPDRARGFVDLDLLSADAHGLHQAMKASGFVEVDDPELFKDHHHLRPLQLPGLLLKVEIHLRPMWPLEASPPPVSELLDAAVPSNLGVAGVLAPAPIHHALLIAAHAWVHEPLHTLRDLIDVAVVSAGTDRAELDAQARRWGIERIWQTTQVATDWALGDPRSSPALRVWARHLTGVRERTVLENHVTRWIHAFWERPFRSALALLPKALRMELIREPDERWRDKATRIKHAFLHPKTPISAHDRQWRATKPASTREDRSRS